MTQNLDWYWSGPLGVWGSARGALVSSPNTDSAYQNWLIANGTASVWPYDESGNQTFAALDDVLVQYGLSTGHVIGNLRVLALNAVTAICAAVTDAVYTDNTDIASYASIASIIIANGGTVPSSGPYSAMVTAFATQIGQTNEQLATMLNAFINGAGELQTARLSFATSITVATTGAQISSYLNTFMTAVDGVVNAINATLPASLPLIPVPTTPSIQGINV